MSLEDLEKVRKIWQAENLELAEPLSVQEVIANFNKLGIEISQDVIDVYSNLGGMINDGIDSICFSFWTIEQVIDENKSDTNLTFFADFLIVPLGSNSP